MWLVLALIGHLANALVFLADKALVEKLFPEPRALAFIAGATGVFAFVLFPWFLLPAPPDVLASALGAGALFVAALVAFFAALGREEVSRVVPAVGAIGPLFTFALSFILLGERLTGQLFLAFGFLAAGGLLIEFRHVADLFSRRFRTTFLMEVAAAFLFAASYVLQKYAFEGTDDISAFLWSQIGAVGAAALLLVSSSTRKNLGPSIFRPGNFKLGGIYFGSRVLAVLGRLSLLAAVALGSATLVNSLQGVQYAFLFILAPMLSRRWPKVFAEEMSPLILAQKSVATASIIFGLYLLI